jgi:hypothetical protein
VYAWLFNHHFNEYEMTTHDGGKGDKQIQPADQDQFDKNWDAIFKQQQSIEFNLEADNDHAEILATIPFGT